MIFIRFVVRTVFHIGIIESFLMFFVLINLLAFLLYFIDRRWAVKGKWWVSRVLLVLFALACGGVGAFLAMCTDKNKAKSTKLRLVVVVGMVIALIPMIHLAHAFTLDRIVRYVEVEFSSPNWPVELNGYRIAFITDPHVISDETIAKVAAELNERNLDLLLLGGDFSMWDGHYQGTIRELAQVATTDGIFGVEGNHDNHEWLFSAMAQHGMTPLDNSGVHIRDAFFLAGVHDKLNRNPNVAEAIAGAYLDDFVLLVSHNPDVTMRQSTTGVDLVLSGHTHSGQITFFGFSMYLLRGSITNYGTRFSRGFAYSADGIPVYTSTGIGIYYEIPRVFARPEVVIFTMYNE